MPQFEQTGSTRTRYPDDLASKLNREADLFGSLKDNLWHEVNDHLRNNKTAIVAETAGAVILGVGIATLSKNPALLGETLAPIVKVGIPMAGKVGIGLGVADWGIKLGLPAYDTWQNPNNLEADEKGLARNVGAGLVDYTAMGLGGAVGGGLGWKLTPELMPKAPEIDLKPSLKLNEVPKTIDHPERFSTQRESELKPDVIKLYEASFPKEERQPTEEVADLVNRGRIIVHTTRADSGKLESFSFVSLHDESATKFAGLDFVATDEASRSSGVGSLHLRRLNESMKANHPDLVAMTLEMEHPKEPDLSADDIVIRARRAKFYDRLDAPNTNIKYNIIDFEDPAYRGMAQHRAFVYKPEKFNAVKAAHTFMTDEGGYQLGKRDPAVLEFNKNNGYWQPPNSSGAVASGYIDWSTENGYKKRHSIGSFKKSSEGEI